MRLPATRLLRGSVSDPPLRCAELADALRPTRPAAPGEDAVLAGLGFVEVRPLLEGLRPTCMRVGRCGDSGSSFLGGGLASSATLRHETDGRGGHGRLSVMPCGRKAPEQAHGELHAEKRIRVLLRSESRTSGTMRSPQQPAHLGRPPFLAVPGEVAGPGAAPPPAGLLPARTPPPGPVAACFAGGVLRPGSRGSGDTALSPSSSGLLARRGGSMLCEDVVLLVGRAMGMMSPMCVGPAGGANISPSKEW